MLEIEIKAKIDNHHSVLEKLNEIGAVYSHSEQQYDIYFNAPHKDFKASDEALRIREVPIDDKLKRILTYKGPKLDSETKTRKEVEVEFDNTENMIDILVNIGFEASAVVKKSRRIFKYGDYEICLDKLEKLGYYLEIEYVSDEDEDVDRIKEYIFNLFEKLDIDSEFERRSYLGLLEENKLI